MKRWAWLVLAGCSPAPPPAGPTEAPRAVPTDPPAWCDAIDTALGGAAWSGFRCLPTPGAVGTGFFGPEHNPDRSDFVGACFGGGSEALELTTRPAGDFRLAFSVERALEAGGKIDLGFLGPWAPAVGVRTAQSEALTVQVELRDAEVRVLSSVGEVLTRRFGSAEAGADRDALESCISALCAPKAEPLFYAAKLVAAVPTIQIESQAHSEHAATVELLGSAAGFETRNADSSALELVAKTKLDVAALLEPARPALERAGACAGVRFAKARRSVVDQMRAVALRISQGRDLSKAAAEIAGLREAVRAFADAFTEEERAVLDRLLEVSAAAARETPEKNGVCEALSLLHDLASGSSEHRLVTLVAALGDPLSRRLTTLANERSLPCAEPVWYRDADADGFGDRGFSTRSYQTPDGHVANSLDCFDRNPNVRPGQRDHFDTHRGDGSFDYDCDGREAPEDALVTTGCQESTRLGIPIRCFTLPGWIEAAPPCGVRGPWLGGCELELFACERVGEEARVQRCR